MLNLGEFQLPFFLLLFFSRSFLLIFFRPFLFRLFSSSNYYLDSQSGCSPCDPNSSSPDNNKFTHSSCTAIIPEKLTRTIRISTTNSDSDSNSTLQFDNSTDINNSTDSILSSVPLSLNVSSVSLSCSDGTFTCDFTTGNSTNCYSGSELISNYCSPCKLNQRQLKDGSTEACVECLIGQDTCTAIGYPITCSSGYYFSGGNMPTCIQCSGLSTTKSGNRQLSCDIATVSTSV